MYTHFFPVNCCITKTLYMYLVITNVSVNIIREPHGMMILYTLCIVIKFVITRILESFE